MERSSLARNKNLVTAHAIICDVCGPLRCQGGLGRNTEDQILDHLNQDCQH